MRKDLIEYGEVARQPINKRTLINHWMTINGAMYADVTTYKFIYYRGGFYELNDYITRRIDTNEYISKIKLVRYL